MTVKTTQSRKMLKFKTWLSW